MKNFIEVGKTEEEQAEQIKKWIKGNALQIIAGVALGFSGIWGFDYYDNQQYKKAIQARIHYLSVAINPSNIKDLNTLNEQYADSPYTQQATLVAAKQAANKGDYQGALDYLLPLANSKDEFTMHTVKLRIANLHLEMGNADQALLILNDNTNKEFSALYNHIKGDAYFAKNDLPAAKKHYQLASSKLSYKSELKNLIEIKLNDIN
ncbi:hypothetical protein [uncultured Gammaproteobacteria bacterium]|jgi:predicted negative regulator of RcsB-dependent stress response|nr:hypothetical protein [uncultured Gammaproteobacteria bacterium]CAC9627960.1 hypothetical protein [uncultured Gammaproteobacteria bacterium]